MTFCCICRDDTFDLTTSCGHTFHYDCIQPWYSRNKCCPYCRAAINLHSGRLLAKPCEVCGEGSSDFVTRCHHFIHKQKCSVLGNKRKGRCPVCSTWISRTQKNEIISTSHVWTNEEIETLMPFSLREIAILMCENEGLFDKISFAFVIEKLCQSDFFCIDEILYKNAGLSLLGIACRCKNITAIKALVRLGASMNANQLSPEFYSPNSPVVFAVQNNDLELLDFLIEHGADVLKVKYLIFDALRNLNGDGQVFNRLIAMGCDPKTLNKWHQTLLMMACKSGYYNAALLLIDQYGLDIEARDMYGFTAFIHTSASSNPDLVDLLVEKGAKINEKTKAGFTAFQLACKETKDLSFLRLFEIMKPKLNSHDPDGMTPLSLAAYLGNFERVKFLLEKGANIHLPTSEGAAPINFACVKGHFEIVEFFLANGCSLNKLGPGAKLLPIHQSVKYSYIYGSLEYLRKLIELGADVNGRDRNGDTALHYAAKRYLPEFVKELLTKYNADVNALNNKGLRPIDVADWQFMTDLLLAHGSKPKQFKRIFRFFSCFC